MIDAVNQEHKIVLAHNNQAIENDGIQVGYFGKNKNRILTDIGSKLGDHTYNIEQNLSRFNYLVAIDTNSEIYQGVTICFGMAFFLIKVKNNGWEILDVENFVPIGVLEDKIENVNWRKLIEFLLQHPNFYPKHKIGIVVDSDLGNIDDYNKRLKPIIDDFYLPENFELLFASDKAQDTILNTAIIACHKVSKDTLKGMIEEFITKPAYFEYFTRTYNPPHVQESSSKGNSN